MEGLGPVCDWLYQSNGPNDESHSMQILDWNYDLPELFPMAPVPYAFEEDCRVQPAPDSGEIEYSQHRQAVFQGNVDPNLLQLHTASNNIDDRPQLLRGTEQSPRINNRVSDWLSKSQPEVLPGPESREITSAQDCSSELVTLRSEISHLQECLRDARLTLEKSKQREAQFAELQRQVEALFKWAAEVSTTLNDFQLKQQGQSPLQKRFGLVLGPRLKRKS